VLRADTAIFATHLLCPKDFSPLLNANKTQPTRMRDMIRRTLPDLLSQKYFERNFESVSTFDEWRFALIVALL